MLRKFTSSGSIGFRLLASLFAAVAVVLAVHAVISFHSTEMNLLNFVRADANRCGELISRATHDGMLLNRLDEVQRTFERLTQGSDVSAVRCYDKQGRIVLSARPEEIGQRIKSSAPTCRSCHDQQKTNAATVFEQAASTGLSAGPGVVRHLQVIPNETSCATAACHYHSPDHKILGVLDVEMSRAPLAAAVATSQGQLIWTTIVLIFAIGLVAALFVQRFVYRPVSQLHAGTQRIARGDLDTRIDIRGDHELAHLADAFNKMAGQLSSARASLTEWSLTLEQKVAEKTEELSRAQRQVLHMEKMASLGKLAASVAHELNNPLAGMLVYARLIKRELAEQSLDPATRAELERYLGLVEQECRRCGDIVKNMLVFSRRTSLKREPVDLNQVVEQCLMLVRHHAEMRGVELRSHLLANDRQITGDADQLQQALLAILVNAVEAIDPASPRERILEVRLQMTTDQARVHVRDTGAGIPSDILPHIFEPFFSTKQKDSGVGLGLAVAYGIIHRHGGEIEVESTPSVGTIFHIHLPRNAPVAEQAAALAGASA